jgi:hypothetical protein
MLDKGKNSNFRVVYETYEFQDLEYYTSGGNIHVIMNN